MPPPDKPKKKALTAGAWEEARALIWTHRKRLSLGLGLMLVSRLAGFVAVVVNTGVMTALCACACTTTARAQKRISMRRAPVSASAIFARVCKSFTAVDPS